MDGTDEEACFYADIAEATLYNYQNRHPEFVERKKRLKKRPILEARQAIIKAINDPINARWYLERKCKKEFAERSELTGAEGKELIFMPSELAKKNDIPSNSKPSGQ